MGESCVNYYRKCCLKKGDTDVAGDQEICPSSLTIDILGNQAKENDLAVEGIYYDSTVQQEHPMTNMPCVVFR